MTADPPLEQGDVAAELAAEHPGIGVVVTTAAVRPGPTPAGVRERLAALAQRFGGAHVVQMRRDAVPWAYRVLWRQVGLDPDVDRPPAEALAVERLRAGGLPSRGPIDDALTIATLETGVPVGGFDVDLITGRPALRVTVEGETLGDGGRPLPAGLIVIADRRRPLAALTGEPAAAHVARRGCERVALVALRAPGVPDIAVEEALWTAAGLLSEDLDG